jgi:hypothetical protein
MRLRMSYEALIAAQAKRLTKKRERGWRDDWRDDCRFKPKGVDTTDMRCDVLGAIVYAPPTYADLYVPPAPGSYGFDGLKISVCSKCLETKCHCPKPRDLSHAEWADGYRKWQSNKLMPLNELAASLSNVVMELGEAALHRPCFAENEI